VTKLEYYQKPDEKLPDVGGYVKLAKYVFL